MHPLEFKLLISSTCYQKEMSFLKPVGIFRNFFKFPLHLWISEILVLLLTRIGAQEFGTLRSNENGKGSPTPGVTGARALSPSFFRAPPPRGANPIKPWSTGSLLQVSD